MATSGSVNSNSIGSFYLHFEWWIISNNIDYNTALIGWAVYSHNTPGNYRSVRSRRIVVAGDTVVNDSSTVINGYEGTLIASGQKTLYRDGNGDCSFYAGGGFGIGQTTENMWFETTFYLDRASMLAITSHWVHSVGLNSATMYWQYNGSSADACQYSLNGGAWTNAPGGWYPYYTISGLNQNGYYSVQTRTKNTYSQVWSYSNVIYFTTKQVPGECTNRQLNNGGSNVKVSVLEKTDTIRLTWDAPAVVGSSAIVGYHIYYSIDSGWVFIGNVGPTVRSYDITLNTIAATRDHVSRGNANLTIGYTAQAYNSDGDGGLSFSQYPTVYLAASSNTYGINTRTLNSISVNWYSNVNISKVYYTIRLQDNTIISANEVDISGDTKLGTVTFNNLTYNTNYKIEMQLKIKSDSTNTTITTISSTYTLDIARIGAASNDFAIEQDYEIPININGALGIDLLLVYNNIEIIGRNNITLTNGKYTLTLTNTEILLLYNAAGGVLNPTIKLRLKTKNGATVIGSDEKTVNIVFSTRTFIDIKDIPGVKTWKRAIGFIRLDPEQPAIWTPIQPYIIDNNVWKIA